MSERNNRDKGTERGDASRDFGQTAWPKSPEVVPDEASHLEWCRQQRVQFLAEPMPTLDDLSDGKNAAVHKRAQEGVSGAGQALPHADQIQASFGTHDISHVKAHVGGDAAAAAGEIGAQAYATGDQVAFAQQPDLHTAAHEAAHVVQQRGGVSLKGGVGQAGDPYEQHADAVADKVVAGESAEDLLGQAHGGPARSAIQFFGADEHRDLGNDASGGRMLDITLDDGSKLSFGDMVMLAQDLFGSLEEMTTLASTKAGQLEIRWARWWTRSSKRKDRGAEPPADEATKKRVKDRYQTLAATNFNHFSAGGTAKSVYEDHHGRALSMAIISGATGQPQFYEKAMIEEAFGQHNLSDMFSSGHVRTPRAAMKKEYEQKFPGSIDRLVHHLASKLYSELSGPIPWYWQASDAIFGNIVRKFEGRIRAQGGPAIAAYSLGDIVSLASHNRDNDKGLEVSASVNPQGEPVSGGFRWHAKGDGQLANSETTRQMATAAMKVSFNEVEQVGMAASVAATVNPPPSVADEVGLLAWVSDFYHSLPPFGALKYIPSALPDGPDSNVALDWHWGSMNAEMIEALNSALEHDILPELRASAPKGILRLNRRGDEDADGAIELDVEAAWLRMCDSLSMADFEMLFGQMAPDEVLAPPAQGPPVDAGVPAGVETSEAGAR